jgi:uncharacterized membrane protein YbhN (UPF0104 family)
LCEFALLRAFYDIPGRFAVDMVGLTTAATALGYAALFAPGGLGVRDGLMAGGVRLLVGKPGAGSLLAVCTRLVALLMDSLSGAVALLLYRGIPGGGRGRTPS